MKKATILFVALAALATGCRHDSAGFGYIIAGDKSGDWIQYKDIADTLLQNATIDANDDNSGDMEFLHSFSHTPHSYHLEVNVIGNQGCYIAVDSNGYALRLTPGEKINEALMWMNAKQVKMISLGSESIPPGYYYENGNWVSGEYYLPFKVKNQKSYVYGWVRIERQVFTFKVKDYAYRE
jgi:hypothetical protein